MNWLIPFIEQAKDKNGDANTFGVILYTDKHPHIKKVLSDNDYWAALDKISGTRWTVFSTCAKAGYYKPLNLPPGTIGEMCQVWKEPNENESLLKAFEIKSTKDLPQLFIFVKGNNGEILSHSFRLDDSSIEKAYNSLKTGIELISKALQGVSPDNLKSAEGIHAAIDLSVSNYNQWRRIKKGLLFYTWVKELLPT